MCENTIAFLPRSMRESLNIRSEELHIFVGSLEIDIYIYIIYTYIYTVFFLLPAFPLARYKYLKKCICCSKNGGAIKV